MRINDAALQQVLQSYKPNGTASGKSQRTSSANGSSPNDQVSISAEGQSLQRLIRAAQDAGDVRSQRVAEIQAQIQSGTYVIDPQAIANRMLGIGGA